jgi:hypothetical protein
MKPQTLGIFSFLVSLVAFQLVGLLIYGAAVSASSYSPGFSTGTNLLIITFLAIVGALLTGLKVYAIERN